MCCVFLSSHCSVFVILSQVSDLTNDHKVMVLQQSPCMKPFKRFNPITCETLFKHQMAVMSFTHLGRMITLFSVENHYVESVPRAWLATLLYRERGSSTHFILLSPKTSELRVVTDTAPRSRPLPLTLLTQLTVLGKTAARWFMESDCRHTLDYELSCLSEAMEWQATYSITGRCDVIIKHTQYSHFTTLQIKKKYLMASQQFPTLCFHIFSNT